MFDKIIVAVDQSLPAEQAIEVAIELAQRFSAWLGVVHVIDQSISLVPEFTTIDTAASTRFRWDGIRALDAAVARIPPSMTVERILLEGEPGERIVAVARQRQADLIVIGSDGRGRFA